MIVIAGATPLNYLISVNFANSVASAVSLSWVAARPRFATDPKISTCAQGSGGVIWQHEKSHTFRFESCGAVRAVPIDPLHSRR